MNEFVGKLNKALLHNSEDIKVIFSEIYEKYYKIVFFVAFEVINNENDAQDISQEVFLNFFKKCLSEKTFNGNIKGFLCVSAHHLSINNIQNKRNSNILYNDSLLYKEDDEEPEFIDVKLIKAWKNSINEDERTLIREHLFFDKTFKEISQETNTSINTIKSSYRRAIKKIRKELNDD